MSSSIIQSASINEDPLSIQYNVPANSKIIPKDVGWPTGYQTKSEQTMDSNSYTTKQEEPAEIEQLIDMMRNHKVSDDTSSFHFNFGSDTSTTKDFKPLTPKTSPQPTVIKPSFTFSPEFQFSFSANVRSSISPPINVADKTQQQQKNYIEVGDDDYYVDDIEYIDDPVRQRETEINTYYNQHLVNRKILPLPKPRWKRLLEKKSSDNNNNVITMDNNGENSSCSSSSSSSSRSSTSSSVIKKLKCSTPPPPPIEHPVVDNKRRRARNWNDNSFTTAEVTEVNKDFFVESKLRIPSHNEKSSFSLKQDNIKNWPTFSTPAIPLPPHPLPLKSILKNNSNPAATTTTTTTTAAVNTTLPKKSILKKKGKDEVANKKPTTSTSTTTATTPKKAKNKKSNNNAKKKSTQKEDMAPGGFLSSDITLFDNPISDDWICLFCQYDILMYGLEDTKRKNGYYRRKREKAKRLKEAELRRLGGLSDSEEDHEHHHHHHL